MKEKIKKIAIGLILAGAAIPSGTGCFYTGMNIGTRIGDWKDKKQEISDSNVSYVIADKNDTFESLFREEGWNNMQIKNYQVESVNILEGDIVAVPQRQGGSKNILDTTHRQSYGLLETAVKRNPMKDSARLIHSKRKVNLNDSMPKSGYSGSDKVRNIY